MTARLAMVLMLGPHVASATVPGVLLRQDQARNYTCERTTLDDAAATHPGTFQPERAHGESGSRTPMVCSERVLSLGLREARDEAILTTLDARAADIASAAWSAHPQTHSHTWLVDVFYPSGAVSSKLDFAAKTALMQHGALVSDRKVGLSAADVDVLTRMPAIDAYASACQRYSDTGTLPQGTVLLSIVTVNPLETTLHAGLCDGGRWTWLR